MTRPTQHARSSSCSIRLARPSVGRRTCLRISGNTTACGRARSPVRQSTNLTITMDAPKRSSRGVPPPARVRGKAVPASVSCPLPSGTGGCGPAVAETLGLRPGPSKASSRPGPLKWQVRWALLFMPLMSAPPSRARCVGQGDSDCDDLRALAAGGRELKALADAQQVGKPIAASSERRSGPAKSVRTSARSRRLGQESGVRAAWLPASSPGSARRRGCWPRTDPPGRRASSRRIPAHHDCAVLVGRPFRVFGGCLAPPQGRGIPAFPRRSKRREIPTTLENPHFDA